MTATRTQSAAPPASATATPENTPLPGGGSWRWDSALRAWVDANQPVAAPMALSIATPETTPE